MNTPIRCAVAGLGRIGSTLEKDPLREKPASHAGAIDNHPRTVLTAGTDPDEKRRDEFAADWGGVRTYENPIEMIRVEKPQIMHIASWTETHPKLLKAALDEGIPVIICEKPLADSLEKVRTVMESARSSSSCVIVNHERRFSRDYRSVRKIIRNRKLGRLHSVSARLFMGRKRPVEQVIYHDGTHMLDIIQFLTGKKLIIRNVIGNAVKNGGNLHIHAKAGKSVVNLEISGGRDHLVFELDLSFTSGRIRIGNGTYEVWESLESPYYTGFRSLVLKQGSREGKTGYFSGMMDHAVSLALNPARKNKSSLEDGYAVLELIRNILEFPGIG